MPENKSSDHLVVYIDTSASMSGFINDPKSPSQAISSDMQTIFSKTVLELRTAATSINQQPQIVVKEVASNVSEPAFGDLAVSNASLRKNIYTGSETNLAATISAFSNPIDVAKDSNPASLHVLITDGIQSTKNENRATDCSTGSDWHCVRKKMKELIDKGWGGSILGIKSEFSGTLFSEINNSKIPYSTGKVINKFRPFYLYIFSPNPKTSEELIKLLKKKLSQIANENSLNKNDVFREFPLTPKLIDGNILSTFSVNPENAGLLQVRQDDKEKAQFNVLVDTQTENKGYKPFNIKLNIPWSEQAKDMDSLEDLKDLIKWELKAISENENEKYRYPEIKLTNKPTINGSEISIDFETGWKKDIGTKGWRLYQLTGKIDPEKMPSWVAKWSTNLDTTSDTANRTLNLESSLATLWNNQSVNDYVIAKVCLRVGDK
ncbi:MAG: hypothetical protein MUC29_00795 [Pyrinomonadaceae bacterium]|nr:hypothetical protein [Pyrinomonadaceae bacterium]